MGRLLLRKRTLDPAVCTDDDLAGMGPWELLLFERLPMIADREGRLEDRPVKIRANLFPNNPELNVDELLEALARPRKYSHGGFILRYEVDGCKYIQIRNFGKYQKPHLREAPSEIPSPPNDLGTPRASLGNEKVSLGSEKASLGDAQAPPRRPDPDPDPDPDPINDPPLRSGSEIRAESPPQAAELELTPENVEPAPTENPNPYHFVVYWQDATAERDFGLRFEPEDGAREFVRNEVERLEIEAPRAEIERTVRSSLEAFRSTYSKRTGRHKKGTRPKTRGSQLHPKQLTEELVAWLRKDLARLAARPRAPTRGMKSVDETINRSMTRARNIDAAKTKGGSSWQPRTQLPKRSPG